MFLTFTQFDTPFSTEKVKSFDQNVVHKNISSKNIYIFFPKKAPQIPTLFWSSSHFIITIEDYTTAK